MQNSGTPGGVPQSTDCALRKLAWDYGRSLAPARGGFRSLFDALQLQECNITTPSSQDKWAPPNYTSPPNSIYVDAETGSDTTGDGSKDRPLFSIKAAIAAARSSHFTQKTLLLRKGTFYLDETLQILPEDSNLTIQNYNGERAVVSGGVAFKPTFMSVASTGGARWTVYTNTNNAFGRALPKRDAGAVKYIGSFDTAAACGDALASNLSYHSWSWQPPTAGKYANQVF
jgi:hypothetical protein